MRLKLLVPDYCQKGVHVQFLQIVGKKFCVEEDTKEAIIVWRETVSEPSQSDPQGCDPKFRAEQLVGM